MMGRDGRMAAAAMVTVSSSGGQTLMAWVPSPRWNLAGSMPRQAARSSISTLNAGV